MIKQLLVTKYIEHVQYQLYKTKMLYSATFNDYKGTIIEQDVLIDAYGITVFITDGQEKIQYDSGPLSSQGYQVNWLFHYIHRQGLSEFEDIREAIWNCSLSGYIRRLFKKDLATYHIKSLWICIHI